jgi:cellulose synthase/poly-beta-1,6-N-acetylglucosamine synthase-like glycosyltransferase
MVILGLCAFLLALAGIVLFAMAAVFLAEVAASLLPRRDSRPLIPPKPFRFVVLVPAHNEALGIARTLRSILPELSAEDRLVVIADNCTDETGHVAEAAGAEVFYRVNPRFRGKGYALDFAMRRLASDPPDAVVFVDADCIVERGSIRDIAALCLSEGRPVQARYDMHFPAGNASPQLTVAAFAWAVKNHVRPLGLKRLGLPCQLMGTGMAFPWQVISRADLNTGNIVEDLALGLDLAAAGKAPLFFPDAVVSSDFPVSSEGQRTQRTRWETGHLQMITGVVRGLLWQGLRTGNRDLIVLALDAAVPPLTFLCLSIGGMLLLSAILATLGGSPLPLGISIAAACALAMSVVLAARHLGTEEIAPNRLGLFAKYALSKLAIYASAITGKRIEWIRSKRD